MTLQGPYHTSPLTFSSHYYIVYRVLPYKRHENSNENIHFLHSQGTNARYYNKMSVLVRKYTKSCRKYASPGGHACLAMQKEGCERQDKIHLLPPHPSLMVEHMN